MTWEEATDALLTHFTTRWTALEATVPIEYANGLKVSKSTETGAWVRLSLLPSFAEPIVIGGRTRLVRGRALVMTYTPAGEGDGLATNYCQTVTTIWDTAAANSLDGDIHLGAPEPTPGTTDPAIPVWRQGVSVPFWFENIV